MDIFELASQQGRREDRRQREIELYEVDSDDSASREEEDKEVDSKEEEEDEPQTAVSATTLPACRADPLRVWLDDLEEELRSMMQKLRDRETFEVDLDAINPTEIPLFIIPTIDLALDVNHLMAMECRSHLFEEFVATMKQSASHVKTIFLQASSDE